MSVDITLKLRMEQIEADLKSLGNRTDKEVRGMVRTFGKGWKQTERQAKRAARETQRAWNDRLMSIRRVSANTFGPMTEDIADAVEAATMFGPAGLIAGASLATIAGGLLAVGGATWAMWELVSGAREARIELEKYNGLADLQVRITGDQAQAMDDFDYASRAVGLSLQRLRVEIAAEVVPAWRDLAVLIVAGTLAIGDAVPAYMKFAGTLRTAMLEAEGLQRVLIAIGTLGASELVGRPLAQSMESLSQAVEDADASGSGYLDRALALIQGLQLQDAAAAEATQSWTKLGRATKDAKDQAQEAAWVMIDLSAEMAEQERETQAIRAEGARMEAQQSAETLLRLEQERDARWSLAQAASGAAIQIAEAAGLGAEGVAAAKLIEAIAYQAAAVARAFAEGGPIAGFGLAAGAVAAIAPPLAQLIAVSGKSAPGMGSGGGGGGAPKASKQDSRGSYGGRLPVSTVEMRYEHRGFGEFFRDHERTRGRSRSRRSSRSWAGR